MVAANLYHPTLVKKCEVKQILFTAVVLKLGSAVLLGSARQIFWDREAPSKKIKTTIPKKKFCVKLSFQATFLPINLKNTICRETLQAT